MNSTEAHKLDLNTVHDPLIVAFEIKNPFRVRKIENHTFRDTWITIWHCDPESDGTDDSCGWTYPNIPEEKHELLSKLATEERDFMVGDLGYLMSPYELIYWIYRLIAWRLHNRESLNHKEMVECMDLAINPGDNLRWYCQAALENPDEFERLFFMIYRQYLRLHRPWWKHPRWHIHHWRIKIHPLQNLRRFLFERCATCGKRFSWGYAPISNGSEVFHHECVRECKSHQIIEDV